MKKITFILAALFAGAVAQAQLRIGVEAGATLGTASFVKDPQMSISKSPLYAPTGGVVFDIPLAGSFSLRPAVRYVQKGVKLKAIDNSDVITNRIESTMKQHFVEVPVLLTWKKELGAVNLFLGAGPSAGIGVKGKTKLTTYIDGIPQPIATIEADPFKKSDYMEEPFKRFEISAAALAGVEFRNGISISASYTHGLNDLNGASDDHYRNRIASLKLGYFFGRK